MNVKKLWFADGRMYIETDMGQVLSQSLSWYPRLRKATEAQRAKYRVSTMGLHWDEIDEDVSFESFTYQDMDPRTERLIAFFDAHPEINISRLAARLGYPRSVFAGYLCGRRKPSAKRLREIETGIRALGDELKAISIS